MPRLTSRDYKSSRRGSLHVRRYRQFLYGAGVGVVLASGAFLYVGARGHQAAAASAAQPAPAAVLAAADSGAPGAAAGAEVFTYPDMLRKSQVVLPANDKHAKRTLPAGRRAQDPAR
jgi:hypothetical protein